MPEVPSLSQPIQVKLLSFHDLDAVAEIHLATFPSSLISRLGKEAARRYYDWQLNSQDEVSAIGAFDGDKLLGFCFSGIFTKALGGYLVSNRQYLMKRLILRPWLLLNPDFFRKIFRGIRLIIKFSKRGKNAPSASDVTDTKSFGILAIATNPQFQGIGVGRLLMESSEQYAMGKGYQTVHLTVNGNNNKAIRFYEKIGYAKVSINTNGQMMVKVLSHDQHF